MHLVRKDYLLYLMIIPGIFYFVVFKYIPIYGLSIAFKDYSIFSTFADAPFVGLDHFTFLFTQPAFIRALKNTILISFGKLIFSFPAPIILSLMINELTGKRYKKFVQTSVLLPNFISWVVISGMVYSILSPSTGIIKYLMEAVGYKGEVINVLGSKEYFRSLIITTDVWKTTGLGTVIYLSAISGIDVGLYESAIIDGAGKWARIWYITLASLRPTIVILLLFKVGVLLNAGFEQIITMYNPLVYSVSEIIDTYVYKMGILQQQYSVGAAAGFFKSMVGLIMVLITNHLAKKVDPDSGIM